MSEIARTTGRGFLVITGAKVWFLLTGAFVNLSLPQFFEHHTGQGTAAFGDYGVVTNLVSILNMVMITGTLQAVSKVVSEIPSRAGQYVWRALAIQLGIGVPIALAYFVVAPQTAQALNDANLSPYIRLSAGIVLMYSFYAIFVGYFNGRKEFVRQASLDIGFATIKTILIIAAVAAGMGVMGALGGFVATAVLMTVAAAFWVWHREKTASIPSNQLGGKAERSGGGGRLLQYMLALMAYTFFLNLIIRTDLFCLKAVAAMRYENLGRSAQEVSLLSSSLSGVYTGMANIARLPYQAVISITFVIFPIISEATFAGDLQAARAYIRQTLRYSLILVGSMAVVLVALGAPLVEAIYPDAYGAGTTALMWLSLGMVAFALTFVGTTILNSAGHPMQSLVVVGGTLAGAAALAILFLIQGDVGTPMLGRAALATLLATTGGLAAALLLIYRKYRATVPPPTILRMVLASILVIGVGRGIHPLPEILWLVWCPALVLAALLGLVYLKTGGPGRRLALIGCALGTVLALVVIAAEVTLGQRGWFSVLTVMVGKMAFLAVLFYALLYLLREFGSEDLRRLKSVFFARTSPGKEG